MKPRVFFFHFNKPASKAAKRPQISVHWCDTCLIVDNVECDVPCRGHINKRQPYFVMKGTGFVRVQERGYMGGRVAIITAKEHIVY